MVAIVSRLKRDSQIQNKYPNTEKKIVTEHIHGTTIQDFYQWLEGTSDAAVASWIEAQNRLTDEVLNNVQKRDSIRKRLMQLQYRDEVLKVKESRNGLFILKKLASEEQPILYFQSRGTSEEERVLVNVNQIDTAGTTSLDYYFPSHNGKTLAYGLSEGGSEWATLYLMDVDTGDQLEEKIERAKWSIIQWTSDSSAFYYTRFPKPGEVPSGEEVFRSHVRFHELGTNPEKDPIIFENPDNPQEYPFPVLSPDDSFMIVRSFRFIASDLYIIDLKTTSPQKKPIVTESQWLLTPFIGKSRAYILSNHESPNFGLYGATKDNLNLESWETILKPQTDILQDIQLVSDKIMALWLHDVKSKVTLHELDGTLVSDIPIPKIGAVDPKNRGGGMSGGLNYNDVYFNYMSFFQAPTTYRYTIPSGTLTEFFSPDLDLDMSPYKVTEVWYPSKDGTKVHMFILHPQELSLTGKNPTILTGYGGFNISYTPFFSPNSIHWVEQGGVFALANIRGGGEHGDDWHKAGHLEKKQNVFDDFIAAAEFLIQERYCSKETLAIYGGSNGGLLVGAVTVQRPKLYAAVYCAVPLLDMLRYHHFSIGKTWIPEYGDPDKPEDFQWLLAYSPYHHVKLDVEYPAILFKTAVNDSRVDPSHALKMTGLMQSNTKTTKPILLRVESAAGHGVGRSIIKLIEEGTEMLSFFHWRLTPL
jgi:prolyl oligopeptidase